MHNLWLQVVLLAAPLVVVPLALSASGFGHINRKYLPVGFLAALFLSVAHTITPGFLGGLLATPWLLYTAAIFLEAFSNRKAEGANDTFGRLCTSFSFLYLVIGAAWALADRFGWQPLDFDPLIVLLTAVHFHYAGFALVWIAGRAAATSSKLWSKRLISAVVAGVPLTAVGITTSHWQWAPEIEAFAVGVMALGGISVGVANIVYALRLRLGWSSWLLGMSGVAILGGMVLAMLYGLRYFWPLPWLTIPWMYTVHGSLNSLGFALPAVLAWWLQRSGQSTVFA